MRDIATRENIKDLILDATDRLLSQNGYQKTTMSALAETVGIAKGTLYLHFPSKEELVLSHIDRIVFRLLVKLQTIAHSSKSAAEKLEGMLVMRVLFRYDSVHHYKGSLSELLRDIRPALTARHKLHFQQEARCLADVLASDDFNIKDPLETAHAMIVATNSLLPNTLSDAELRDRRAIERRISLIAHMLINGIKK
ncbi:MAG TPA: helix-turn-helix domain-containing protein [Pyrinomonadaceae bacterium]